MKIPSLAEIDKIVGNNQTIQQKGSQSNVPSLEEIRDIVEKKDGGLDATQKSKVTSPIKQVQKSTPRGKWTENLSGNSYMSVTVNDVDSINWNVVRDGSDDEFNRTITSKTSKFINPANNEIVVSPLQRSDYKLDGSDFMTQEEKNQFNSTWETNPRTALSYYKEIFPALKKRESLNAGFWERNIVTGLNQGASGVLGVASLATDIMGMETSENLKALLGASKEYAQGAAEGNAEEGNELGGAIVQGFAQFIPQVLAYAINPVFGRLSMGITAGGNYSEIAKDKGATLTERMLYGTVGGTLEVALQEILYIDKLLSKSFLKGISSTGVVQKGVLNMSLSKKALVGDAIQGFIGEGLEEALINPFTNLVEKFTFNKDMAGFGEGGVLDLKQMAYDGLVGGIVGGGISSTNAILTVPKLQETKDYIDKKYPQVLAAAYFLPDTSLAPSETPIKDVSKGKESLPDKVWNKASEAIKKAKEDGVETTATPKYKSRVIAEEWRTQQKQVSVNDVENLAKQVEEDYAEYARVMNQEFDNAIPEHAWAVEGLNKIDVRVNDIINQIRETTTENQGMADLKEYHKFLTKLSNMEKMKPSHVKKLRTAIEIVESTYLSFFDETISSEAVRGSEEGSGMELTDENMKAVVSEAIATVDEAKLTEYGIDTTDAQRYNKAKSSGVLGLIEQGLSEGEKSLDIAKKIVKKTKRKISASEAENIVNSIALMKEPMQEAVKKERILRELTGEGKKTSQKIAEKYNDVKALGAINKKYIKSMEGKEEIKIVHRGIDGKVIGKKTKKTSELFKSFENVIEIIKKNPIFRGLEVEFSDKIRYDYLTEREVQERGYSTEGKTKGTDGKYKYRVYGVYDNNVARPRILLYKGANRETILEETIHYIQKRISEVNPEFAKGIEIWNKNLLTTLKKQGIKVSKVGQDKFLHEHFAHAIIASEMGWLKGNEDIAEAYSIDSAAVASIREIMGKELFDTLLGEELPNTAKESRPIAPSFSELIEQEVKNGNLKVDKKLTKNKDGDVSFSLKAVDIMTTISKKKQDGVVTVIVSVPDGVDSFEMSLPFKEFTSIDEAGKFTVDEVRLKDYIEKTTTAMADKENELKKGDVVTFVKASKTKHTASIVLTQGCGRNSFLAELILKGIMSRDTEFLACYGGTCFVNLSLGAVWDANETYVNVNVRETKYAPRQLFDKWFGEKDFVDGLQKSILLRHGVQGDDSHTIALGFAKDWLQHCRDAGITTRNVFISAGYAPVTDEQYRELAEYNDISVLHVSVSPYFTKNENLIRLAEFKRAKAQGVNVVLRFITNRDNISGIDMSKRYDWMMDRFIELKLNQSEVLETPYHDNRDPKDMPLGYQDQKQGARSEPTGDFLNICCETGKCNTCKMRCMNSFKPYLSSVKTINKMDTGYFEDPNYVLGKDIPITKGIGSQFTKQRLNEERDYNESHSDFTTERAESLYRIYSNKVFDKPKKKKDEDNSEFKKRLADWKQSRKYAKAYVTKISPEAFLSLTTPNVNDIIEESKPLDIERIRKLNEPIYLVVDTDTGEVVGHEGRHRMAAFMAEGLDEVPIVVQPSNDNNKLNMKKIPSLKVTGQDFGSIGKSSGTYTLENILPLSREYENQVYKDYVRNDANFSYSMKQDKEIIPLSEGEPYAPVMYSKLQNVIGLNMRENANYNEVVDLMKNKQIKPDEIKWSGIMTFLEGKDKINKQELLDFLRASELNVVDILKQYNKNGDEEHFLSREEIEHELNYLETIINEIVDSHFDVMFEDVYFSDEEIAIMDDEEAEYWEEQSYNIMVKTRETLIDLILFNPDFDSFDFITSSRSEESFKRYLSSNQEYVDREFFSDLQRQRLLRYISEKIDEYTLTRVEQLRYEDNRLNDYGENIIEGEPKWTDYTVNAKVKEEAKKVNYREYLFTIPDVKGTFTVPIHWDDIENVFAHLRMNDVMDANTGEAVLFIDEVQSDWHEKALKRGYVGESKLSTNIDDYEIVQVNLFGDEISEQEKEAMFKFNDKMTEPAVKKYRLYTSDGKKLIYESAYSYAYDEERLAAIKNEMLKLALEFEDEGKLPDAPYRKTWHEYVMKRAIRIAAEEGYDRIAWTTGKQQSDFYGLEKIVRSINWEKIDTAEGILYILEGYSAKDNSTLFTKQFITLEKVEEILGKDMTKQIVESEKETGTIFPEDMTIGGEGMKNFYDIGGRSSQNLPKYLNKYGKQWGASVETVTLESYDTPKSKFLYGVTGKDTPFKWDAPSMAITPEMKESVLRVGQEMFQMKPAGEITDMDIWLGGDMVKYDGSIFMKARIKNHKIPAVNVYKTTEQAIADAHAIVTQNGTVTFYNADGMQNILYQYFDALYERGDGSIIARYPQPDGIRNLELEYELQGYKGEELNIKDSEDSNLTLEQVNYFRRSKVRDIFGRLLRVYHGTGFWTPQLDSHIENFKKTGLNEDGYGYFSIFKTESHFGNKSQANERALLYNVNELRIGERVYPVYLDIQNPKRMRDIGTGWDKIVKTAKIEGYDGIVYLNRYEGITKKSDGYHPSTDEVRFLIQDAYGDSENVSSITDTDFLKLFNASQSYIIFNSNQAKSIFNPSPTKNVDIMMSMIPASEIQFESDDVMKGVLTSQGRVDAFKQIIQTGNDYSIFDRDDILSPIKVVKNGDSYIAYDGNHRLMAYKQLGENTLVPSIVYNSYEEYKKAVSAEDMSLYSMVQTEQADFKRWFANSAVVTELGEPKRVFHGTPFGFSGDFSIQKISMSSMKSQQGAGFYFTDNKSLAKAYMKKYNILEDSYSFSNQAELYEVYLSIQNPLDITEGKRTITDEQIFDVISSNDYEWKVEWWKRYYTQEKTISNAEVYDLFINDMKERNDKYIVQQLLRWYKNPEYYLERLQKVLGYDGIIDRNPKANIYVAFSPKQIVRASSNPKASVELEKGKTILDNKEASSLYSLVAVHNLTLDNLKDSMELGAIPMPSVAITKQDLPFVNFGEVSLVFNKDTINPALSPRNKVYGGDAWTPTVPFKRAKINSKKADEIYNKIKSILGHDMYAYRLAIDEDNMSDKINRSGKEFINYMKDEVGFMVSFIKDKGIPFKEVMNEKNLTTAAYVGNDILKKIDEQIGDKLLAVRNKSSHEIMELTDEVTEIRNTLVGNSLGRFFNPKEEKVSFHDLLGIIDGIFQLRNEGITDEINYYQTRDKAAEVIAKHKDEYDKWMNNLFDGIIEKVGFRNDKELFTRSGIKRDWEYLHDEFTIDNIMKAMLKEESKATGALGNSPTTVAAAATKEYNSITEIKKDLGRLNIMSEEDYAAVRADSSARMADIISDINTNHQNPFERIDYISEIMTEVAAKGINTANAVQNYFKKNVIEITKEKAQEIVDYIEWVKDIPTGYFEAKPRRAIYFNEIKRVVLPAGTEQSVIDRLHELGVSDITDYDGNQLEEQRDADRWEEVITTPDVLFQMNQESADKLATWFADSKITDTQGNPRIMYRSNHRLLKEDGVFYQREMDMIYLTTSREFAESWKYHKGNREVYPVYVYSQNPYDWRNEAQREEFKEHFKELFDAKYRIPELMQTERDIQSTNDLWFLYESQFSTGDWFVYESPFGIQTLIDLGYDSMWEIESDWSNEEYGAETLAVFDSSQCKSVDAKEFNRGSNNIFVSMKQEPEIKVESYYKTFTNGDVSKRVRKKTEKAMLKGKFDYAVLANETTMVEARLKIDNEGIDVVESWVMSDEAASPMMYACAMLLQDHYMHKKIMGIEYRIGRVVDITEKVSEKARTQGQAIQALSMWGRLSPEGIIRYATKLLTNSMTPRQKKVIQDYAFSMKIAFEQLEAKAAENVDIAKIVEEIKREYDPEQEQARAIARILATAVEGDEVSIMAETLLKYAKERFPDDNYTTALEFVATAIKNRKKYKSVWNRTQSELWDLIPDEQKNDLITSKFFNYTPTSFVEASKLKEAIGDELKEMNTTIRQIVLSSYENQNTSTEAIINSLMSKVDLNRTDAEMLENKFRRKLAQMTEASKRSIANNMLGATKKGEPSSAVDKLIKMSNIGALTDSQYELAIGQKLGIHEISPTFLSDLHNKAQMLQTLEGQDRIEQSARILDEIASMQPVSIWRKVSMFQTLMQLLNPVTFLRNIYGNTLFAASEYIADNFAVPLDVLAYHMGKTSVGKRMGFSGERTTLFRPIEKLRVQAEAYKGGFKRSTREIGLGIDTQAMVTKFDVPYSKVFRGRVMSAAERLLAYELRTFDSAAYAAAKADSIEEQMLATGATEVTQEMIDNAHLLGLYRTFQDDTALSNMMSKMKAGLNNVGFGKKRGVKGSVNGFGLGDLVLKYPRTPANLLARGIDYSPAGAVAAVFKFATDTGDSSYLRQKLLVQGLSRSLTGTILIGIGIMLKRLGIIFGGDNDEEATNLTLLKKSTGLSQYQINVSAMWRWIRSGAVFGGDAGGLQSGDKLWTYDWAQPMAVLLALGADIEDNKATGGIATNTIVAIEQSSSTLVEQPLLRGITTLFGANGYGSAGDRITQGIMKTAQSAPSSFMPSMINRLTQAMYNDARNPYNQNDYFRTALNLMQQRTPLAEGLGDIIPKVESYTTPFGADSTYYKDDKPIAKRVFDAFLNPAYVNEYSPDPLIDWVLKLAEARPDQDTTIAPSAKPKWSYTIQNRDGTENIIKLTQSEYKELSVYQGKMMLEEYQKLYWMYGELENDTQVDRIVKQISHVKSNIAEKVFKKVKEMRGL